MKLRFVAAVAAAATLAALPFVPTATAHTGASFCEATYASHGEGAVRAADQTQAGHGEGECTTGFQGTPLGVIGRYEAISTETGLVDPTAPADVHVEVWLRFANGTRQKYAECEDGGLLTGPKQGVAQCEAEGSGVIGQPVTLFEPAPSEIVAVECLAHSHGRVKVGTAPVARFGCYSTDEAEAALRSDMGIPATEPEPEPEPEPGPGLPAVPAGPPAAITSVPSNTYAPTKAVVTRDSALTYVNMDAGVFHDVVALEATRPAGSAPWCSKPWADFGLRGCPLFASDLIKGGVGVTDAVEGLKDAAPGDYAFFCSIHPEMRGTITVLGA